MKSSLLSFSSFIWILCNTHWCPYRTKNALIFQFHYHGLDMNAHSNRSFIVCKWWYFKFCSINEVLIGLYVALSILLHRINTESFRSDVLYHYKNQVGLRVSKFIRSLLHYFLDSLNMFLKILTISCASKFTQSPYIMTRWTIWKQVIRDK